MAFAEKLEIVQLNAANKVVSLIDLNDDDHFLIKTGTFKVVAPVLQRVEAADQRRWGGSRQVGQTEENGVVSWEAGVTGDTEEECLAMLELLLAQLAANPFTTFVLWQPPGASGPTLYEMRGVGQYEPVYEPAQFGGAQLFVVQITIPVAPLAQGLPVQVLSSTSTELPTVFSLPDIPGDAPAKTEVSIETTAGSEARWEEVAVGKKWSAAEAGWKWENFYGPPIWALLGWAAEPESGLAPAPFGVLDSSAAKAISGWAYGTLAGARGGKALHGSASSASAAWEVDPATMVPDSFSGELSVEVWARVLVSSALSSPLLTLSAQPQDGLGYGAARYTDEWGSAGRPLVLPSAGEVFRMTRLGTLHLLVNPLAPRIWMLVVESSSGAAAQWGLDYLLLVPSTQRACSPSGKPNNSSYPQFIANADATVKTIRSDLSALVAKPGKYGHPDHGLGGQLLELPPGDTVMLLKLTGLIPDCPEINVATEYLSYGAKIVVNVTPRYFLTTN